MKRIPIIDLVRFGSIFIVLGGHFFPSWVVQSISSVLLRQTVLNVFHHGAYGVSCFFVVSGYLITEMLVRDQKDFSGIDLRSFYVRRVARIWPLLAMVVLVALFLAFAKGLLDPRVENFHVWDDETHFGWTFWLSLATFNFNWYLIHHLQFEGFQWNVLWSLAVEEQFYFCYPFILKVLRSREKVLMLLAGVIVSGLLFRWGIFLYWGPKGSEAITPSFAVLDQMASFSNFDQIAIGGALYFLHEKWGIWFGSRPKLSLALWGVGLLVCFLLCDTDSALDRERLIYVPTLIALSCALSILGGLHVPLLFSRPAQILSWPGKLSYGCYLWHPTVTFLLMPVLVTMDRLESFFYLTVAVFVFAFLSYRCLEVPVNHRIRRWFQLKPSPLA